MSAKDYLGRQLSSFTFDVERSQLLLFAKAIGEQRPMYLDVDAARAAGYRDLPAPATFPFTIGMNPADQFDMLKAIDVDPARVLHGERRGGRCHRSCLIMGRHRYDAVSAREALSERGNVR